MSAFSDTKILPLQQSPREEALIEQFLRILRPVQNKKWTPGCYYPREAFSRLKKEKRLAYQTTYKQRFPL